jgi:hypothetical protein
MSQSETAPESHGSAGEEVGPPGRFGAATLGAPPLRIAPVPEPDQPAPKRRRRWLTILTVLVVLALLAGAVLGGRIWGRHGSASVWMVTRDLAAGQALQASDVRKVRVADAAASGALPISAAPVGQVATRSLQQGQVLRPGALGRQAAVPSTGVALVGIGLPAGTAPLPEIIPGDAVSVLQLPPPPIAGASGLSALVGTATVVLRRVEVISMTGTGSGAVVTVAVPQTFAPVLTALSAANRIAVVRVP